MGRCRDTHPSGRTMRTSTRGACSTGYTCALLVARRHSAPQPCHSQPGRGEAGLDLGSRGPGLLEPTDLQRAGCVGGRDGAHASGRPEVRTLTQLLPRLLPLPALRCVARPAHSVPLAIRETRRGGGLCVCTTLWRVVDSAHLCARCQLWPAQAARVSAASKVMADAWLLWRGCPGRVGRNRASCRCSVLAQRIASNSWHRARARQAAGLRAASCAVAAVAQVTASGRPVGDKSAQCSRRPRSR